MHTSINGIFENGFLTLLEIPPTAEKSKVIVTFINEIEYTAAPPLPSDTTKNRAIVIEHIEQDIEMAAIQDNTDEILSTDELHYYLNLQ
jgi:hypothetical protein